jgi:hypothetical protein
VNVVSGSDESSAADSPTIIVRQSPVAGQRVTAGAAISFDVRK